MTGTAALQVTASDPTPAYEQLRRQLVALILSGAVAPGERLPPLRQLASDLGLAVGTVARTYRELESAGLVASRRGAGTRVLPRTGAPPDAPLGQALRTSAEELVQRARRLGASDEQVLGAVTDALALPTRGAHR